MSKKRKQFRKGMVVKVKFSDHVEDGSEPEEFIVFGQIAEVHRKYICVDSWKYANNVTEYDDNVKRFTLLRSTILEWKRLIEESNQYDTGNDMGFNTLSLEITKKTDPRLLQTMSIHYSHPKGFVGRSIPYAIYYDCQYYGHIISGSATLHLAGRHEFLGTTSAQLNNIINNTYFHVTKINGVYPCRNFVSAILKAWRLRTVNDWYAKYGDIVVGFETLVELPRTGDCYKRDGWTCVGKTIGFTCKRVGGKGTDSYTGKRVWNTNPDQLRPKLILCRKNSK